MAYYKVYSLINNSKNYSVQTNKRIIFFEKKTKISKYNSKNIINKRILIILFLLYIKIQISISDNPVITLKINKGTKSKIMSINFKDYLSEVYVNGEFMTTLDNYYQINEDNSTVKIILKSQITNCNKLFHNCDKITEIKLENFDSSNIESLSESFYGCSQLKSRDLSDWDVSKVTNINSLFENSGQLTSIKLPDFTKSNITSLVNVFRSCKKLQSLN